MKKINSVAVIGLGYVGLPLELEGTVQSWDLNEYDLALLQRLIASDEVPSSMKEICEAMLAKGLKAEQEGWL